MRKIYKPDFPDGTAFFDADLKSCIKIMAMTTLGQAKDGHGGGQNGID
jgi:hypothetical protein